MCLWWKKAHVGLHGLHLKSLNLVFWWYFIKVLISYFLFDLSRRSSCIYIKKKISMTFLLWAVRKTWLYMDGAIEPSHVLFYISNLLLGFGKLPVIPSEQTRALVLHYWQDSLIHSHENWKSRTYTNMQQPLISQLINNILLNVS